MSADDTIDPEIIATRQLQAAAVPALDVTRLPIREGRALANKAALVLNDGLPALARVEDHRVVTTAGDIRARLFQASEKPGPGTLLYIHGGGWFACDVDTHDRMLRVLAQQSGLSIVAFDYRLAPEHPYPAALEDTAAVWRWLHDAGPELGIPSERVAIGGDSAGANLALATALLQRDARRILPRGLILLYGCFAPGIVTDSQRRYGTGTFGLTTERLAWYWNNYLGANAAAPPTMATPFHADFRALPPTFVGVTELDVLADENRMLAERMRLAGVAVQLQVWPSTTHGFLQMTRDAAIARAAVATIARAAVQLVTTASFS